MDFRKAMPFLIVAVLIVAVVGLVAFGPMSDESSLLGYPRIAHKYCCVGGVYNAKCVSASICKRYRGTSGATCTSDTYCKQLITTTTPIITTTTTTTTTTPLITCTDSDGGRNYNVRGTVFLNGQNYTDFCWNYNQPNYGSCFGIDDNCTLVEHYCSLAPTNQYTNQYTLGKEKYVCPESCRDGACVATTTTTTPYFPQVKTENVHLDSPLSSAFGSIISHIGFRALFNGTVPVVNNPYLASEKLFLYDGIAVETGLTSSSPDEDFKSDAFIEVNSHSIAYHFSFETPLGYGDYISNATMSNPAVIKFLGRDLKIVGAYDSDSMRILEPQGTVDTVNNGDAYCIGEVDIPTCEDAEIWLWDLGGLNGPTPKIGVVYNRLLDEADEVIKVGQEFRLPHSYLRVRLDNYTVQDYKKYTVEADEVVDLYPATGSTILASTAHTLHLFGEGSSKDSIEDSGSHDTDDLYLYNNGTTNVHVFYKDSSDNKIRYVATVPGTGASMGVGYFTYQDTRLPLLVEWDAAIGEGNITLDATTGDDLIINIEKDGSGLFSYLGETDSDTTYANDLLYGTRDISGWEEDTRAENGIIIYDPRAHLPGDYFEFYIPGNEYNFTMQVSLIR
ncbi:hypothetical protein A3K63_01870 [Candidatus Micrarchaeota archaeon RBG_16_49_10]|nr:MAG: hypothetical protein A3K63_01870 [Candidatus Micrarchaeota archaeon RBG_16_49_10]